MEALTASQHNGAGFDCVTSTPHSHEKVKSLAEIMCHLGKLSRAGAKFAFARQISTEPEEGDLCSMPLSSDLHSLA